MLTRSRILSGFFCTQIIDLSSLVAFLNANIFLNWGIFNTEMKVE
jgi:hypothetical protein